MATTTANGWTILDKDAGVLYREYDFGGGIATTLAYRSGVGDELHVMSPANKMSEAAFKELDEFGKVTALITCNGFHWLGQPEWRTRYPGAVSYGPDGGLKRLRKKVPSATWESVSALKSAANVRCYELPGLKMANALVTIDTPTGTFWYPSDFIANIPKLPPNFLLRFLFQRTDSGPGYKLFRLATWLMIKDKAAAREAMLAEVHRHPLRAVIPAHGKHVEGGDLLALTEAQLARLK